MLIQEVVFNDKCYKLINSNKSQSENVYTIILGKNASGKSELLRECISSILRVKVEDEKFSPYNDLLDPYLNEKYKSLSPQKTAKIKLTITSKNCNSIIVKTSKTNEPREIKNFKGDVTYLKDESFRYDSNIFFSDTTENEKKLFMDAKLISVSESPYIKFPEMKENGTLNYHYLHHKKVNDSSMNFWNDDEKADNKVQTLTLSLLKLLSKNFPKAPYTILEFVGLASNINIKLKLTSQHSRNSENLLSLYEKELKKSTEHFNLRDEISKAKSIIDLFNNTQGKENTLSQRFSSDIVKVSFKKDTPPQYCPKSLERLIEFGFVNLVETEFKSSDDWVNAMSLSSGQLSILNTVVGIDSLLEDNSIVFIDEPEISLHPEWQSTFMPFIGEQFKKYSNCHFIIATHSPHIISNVKPNSSYVVLIEDDDISTIDGEDVSKKSTDLLLTQLFKTPGHKNEYLLRLLLTTYSKLVDKIELNKDDLDSLRVAKKYYQELDSDDPVKYIAEKALNLYAI